MLHPSYLFCVLMLTALPLVWGADERKNLHTPLITLGKTGLSSTSRRMKEAADHINYAGDDGPADGLTGVYNYGKGAWHGAKDSIKKTKSNWQEKKYGKAAGHATLVAGRPLAAVVTSPVPLVTGVVKNVVGLSAAAGSVVKLAGDGVKKVARGRESKDQKDERYLANQKEVQKGNASRERFYGTITAPSRKISQTISGRKPHS